jgi:hypothetical protein
MLLKAGKKPNFLKSVKLGVVVHVYSSCSGEGDGKVERLRPAQAKLARPYSQTK